MGLGSIARQGAETWRDYELESVPASGPHQPLKSDARTFAMMVDMAVQALASSLLAGNAPSVADTLVHLNAIVAPAAGQLGVVYADPGNNGFYIKTGAANAAGWQLTGIGFGLPGPVGPQGPAGGNCGLIGAANMALGVGRWAAKTSLADLAPVLPQLADVQPGDVVEIWDGDYQAAANPWTVHAFAGDEIIYQALAPAGTFTLNVNGVRAVFMSMNTYWRASYVVA